jgi:hypothetical protein
MNAMAVLISSLTQFGRWARWTGALARLEAHYARAQEHLAEVTVDEPSLAKVERDAPM